MTPDSVKRTPVYDTTSGLVVATVPLNIEEIDEKADSLKSFIKHYSHTKHETSEEARRSKRRVLY